MREHEAWDDAARAQSLALTGGLAAFARFRRGGWNFYRGTPEPCDQPSRLDAQLSLAAPGRVRDRGLCLDARRARDLRRLAGPAGAAGAGRTAATAHLASWKMTPSV
jgi:hypothetical protein